MRLIDDRYCFVCGEKNQHGLRLKFDLEGAILKTRFTPDKILRGKPRSILQRSSTARHVLREELIALSSPKQASGYSRAVIKDIRVMLT